MRGVADEVIAEALTRLGHVGLTAVAVGLQPATVLIRLKKMGAVFPRDKAWTPREEAVLRKAYPELLRQGGGAAMEWGRLQGRSLLSIAEQAHLLRLTATAEEGPLLLGDDGIEFMETLGAALPYGLTNVERPAPVKMVVQGAPVPWPRAGANDRGFYLPRPVLEAQTRMGSRFATLPLFDGNVAVGVTFYVGTKRRVDVDNLLKTVLDAGSNGRLWFDDAQVTLVTAQVEYAKGDARTVLVVQGYGGASMPRGRAHWPLCDGCGERFNPQEKKNPTTCSTACAMERQGVLV